MVIPEQARFTVDLRNTDEERLQAAESELAAFLDNLAKSEGVKISRRSLARFEPVAFDRSMVGPGRAHRAAARLLRPPYASGAGHDAQILARVAQRAMIFVPSMAASATTSPSSRTPSTSKPGPMFC